MIQRWTVGEATLTAVTESEFTGIPPELFLPAATAEAVAAHEWVVPTWADERGHIAMRVQATLVELPGRTVLVDPCVGDGKARALPFWHDQHWGAVDRLRELVEPTTIDTVVHTHLHADHVGWDTHPDGDAWVPTFTAARHLYTQGEVAHWRSDEQRRDEDVWADSVQPIFDAGLADVVEVDADLGDGLRLASTPGHTPGHTSLWIESGGATAVITGDLIHHPVQCAEPQWNEIGDVDEVVAEATRRAFLHEVADTDTLVLGTHFPARPAGRVVTAGDGFRFLPA